MKDILDRCFRPSADAAESPVGDETVILHLTKGTYFGLDAVGTRIWKAIKEGETLPATCRRLAREYEVDVATVEADARQFLGELEAQGILVDAPA